MPGFNHYAKLRRITDTLQPGWYIVRINEPTRSQKFNGEIVNFDHYYRIYTADGAQVPYGKFQQLERLAKALQLPAEALPVITEES